MKWEELMIDSRKDFERTLRSLRNTEALEDDVLKTVRECNRTVKNLDLQKIGLV